MMAWIFQPENYESSPFSQDMGDTVSPSDSPDSTSGRSAMSSMTVTPSSSSSNGSRMNLRPSIPLRYGTTSTASTLNPGGDTLTSSAPVSPASHTPKPEPVGSRRDSTTTETSGPRRGNVFGWYDRDTQSLRTFQGSFFPETEDGNLTASKFSENFPRWGSVRSSGEFIALPMPVLPTCAADGSSWPTPTPTPRNEKESLKEWEGRREREMALGRNGNGFGMPLDIAVRYFPHPKGFHIPTPTTADVYTGKMKSSQQSDGSMHSVNLPDYVEMFPTPSTMDHIERKGMRPSRAATNRTTGYLSETVDGLLCPDWETWLMGCPDGWTVLEPLPEGSYAEWLQRNEEGTWWKQWWGPWWRDCPNTAPDSKDRKARLHILGNGIVPASGALAVRDMMSWCWETIDAGVAQEDAKRRGK